jgi:inosose dehydratase
VSGLRERVAGAPITWGVCEVPAWGHQLPPERVLGEMARIGLRATELGPRAYLPEDPVRLLGELAPHGLQVVGGFVPAILHRDDGLEAQLMRVAEAADLLAAVGSRVLVLAATTGEMGYEGSQELDARAWRGLVRGIDRVVELCSDRGLTVALHPHHGTLVEGARHVERLLESSTVPVCIDTGHLVIGGADPVDVVRSAGRRVAHVHLKDVSAHLADQVRTRRMGYRDAVRRGMYRPLGEGDADIAELVRVLERSRYEGWYVLEQDAVLGADPEAGSGPVRDAATSMAFLERVVGEVDIEATG